MQMNFILCFVVFIFIMSYLFYHDSQNNELFYVKSSVDNKKYLVQNMQDKEQAANTLAQIRSRLLKLTDHLNKTQKKDERVRRLIEKFNPDNMMETEPGSKFTSYSVNKGEKIHMCLRSRDGRNQIEEFNTLMFVALHEISHIMTKSVGHTKEFWANFKYLLEQAVSIGIYTPIDYSKEPQEYCGIQVTDTPLKM